jgi:hypothetical protein
MARQYEKTIFGASKNILVDGAHFVSLPVKLDASKFAVVDGRKIAAAGTIVSKTGAPVNDATAYGVLYNDVDLTYGNENGPVVVHGVVELAKLPVQPAAEAKTAMKDIRFE